MVVGIRDLVLSGLRSILMKGSDVLVKETRVIGRGLCLFRLARARIASRS